MLLSIRRFSDQAQATDLALTRRLRRLSDTPWVLAGFASVSRLGDGLVWYLLMLALLLLGDADDQRVVLQMALLGGVSLLAYKGLKRLSKRPRPLSRERALATAVAPLDEFSFPSGHTLHAVGFTLVGTYRRVGFKHGAWRDVSWYERALGAYPAPPAPPRPLPDVTGEPGFGDALAAGERLAT